MAAEPEPFDWFSLPPELRDWTLDYMALDAALHLKTPGIKYFQLLVHNAPRTNLRLVSRQFQEEYCKRVKKLTGFSFRDHRACEFHVPPVPLILSEYPLHSLHLLAFRHNTLSDLDRHIGAFQDMVPKLPGKAVELRLYCETDEINGLNMWPQSPKHDEVKGKLMRLVAIPGIVRLQLHWYDGKLDGQASVDALQNVDDDVSEELRKNIDDVLAGPQNLLESWTKAKGWQHHSTRTEGRLAEDGESSDFNGVEVAAP